jgi:hypothetical protein
VHRLAGFVGVRQIEQDAGITQVSG